MLCARVARVCLLLCLEEGSFLVSAITERRDMGFYEVLLSMFFFDEDYISQLPYIFVKSSFQHPYEGC